MARISPTRDIFKMPPNRPFGDTELVRDSASDKAILRQHEYRIASLIRCSSALFPDQRPVPSALAGLNRIELDTETHQLPGTEEAVRSRLIDTLGAMCSSVRKELAQGWRQETSHSGVLSGRSCGTTGSAVEQSGQAHASLHMRLLRFGAAHQGLGGGPALTVWLVLTRVEQCQSGKLYAPPVTCRSVP